VFLKVTLKATGDPIEVLSRRTDIICAEFTRLKPLDEEVEFVMDEAAEGNPETV
jgi:hypothetical protein